jgi:hypothetical protein
MSHSTFEIQKSKFTLQRYDHFTTKPGLFLSQVVGESMNRRIPNDWGSPRNLTFSSASRKANDPKEPIHRVEILKCET